jgi:hypothetical protein
VERAYPLQDARSGPRGSILSRVLAPRTTGEPWRQERPLRSTRARGSPFSEFEVKLDGRAIGVCAVVVNGAQREAA